MEIFNIDYSDIVFSLFEFLLCGFSITCLICLAFLIMKKNHLENKIEKFNY